jgi:enamine deaminase RidA (YjgF/YER057c/UK114 family)
LLPRPAAAATRLREERKEQLSPHKEIIRPPDVSPPLSHYSHATRIWGSNLVFAAGQLALDETGNLVGPGDCAAQCRQVFHNLDRVFAAAGTSLANVVKFTTFLVRSEDVAVYRSVRESLFEEIYPTGGYPPHTLVVINQLVSPEFLVEIEATATLD